MMKSTYTETLKKVMKYLKNHRKLLWLSLFLALVTTAAALYVPIVVGRAIDDIKGAGSVDFDAIKKKLIAVMVLVFISAVSNWFMNLVNNRLTYHTIHDIRKDAIDKLQKLPMNYFDTTQTGDVVSRVISDVDLFADGLLLGFSKLFTSIITVIGTLFFLLMISPLICGLVVVLTPVSFLIAGFIAKNTHSMFIATSRTNAEETAYIDEMIGNAKLVRAYGYEDRAALHFAEINTRLKKYAMRATFFSSLVNPSTRFLNNIIYALVGLLGAFACVKGNMSIGELTVVLSYSTQYAKPFNEISGVITELTGALACAGRIFEVLEAEEEIPDAVGAKVLENPSGNVEIENVFFSYDKSRKLIENFSLSVKPGQMIAIVGPTGCGKTTFINLLMRFYDVDDGKISVDDEEIRRLTRKSLRAGYGMVLQDTWLASGTIKENIAMGRPDATMEEIVTAAKSAYADGFIRRLPEGYDTYLSEGGGSLSAGQKQLLCIARIMLAKPSMLILDEATSSIDTRTELKIQAAFSKLMEGRTSFIVAHRLSTIQNADKIVVMKDGHILETGSHNELLARGGFYHELFNAQFNTGN
ncbi:MAG: ABC transporter ATP-binding protein [Lachnospiraceae bacterium]|nr:ABC transporter ATP-binding protein [Lachnospiraceae bacterium]